MKKFPSKGNSNATKLVDLKQAVFTLNMELTAVQHEGNLQANPHVLTHILSIMPHEYSKDFVRRQSALKATHGSQWKALSEFLKEEANIINRDMPWLLDNRGDRSRFSSENIGNEKISPLGQSKGSSSFKKELACLPPALRGQVNATLSGSNQDRGSSTGSSNQRSIPKSARFEEMATKIGKCLLCKELHTYVSQSRQLFVSGSFKACDKFKDMDVNQKAKLIEQQKACALCLQWGHQRADCTRNIGVCPENNCGLQHNKLLYSNNVWYCNNVEIYSFHDCEEGARLLHIMKITMPGLEAAVMLDTGADFSFVAIVVVKALRKSLCILRLHLHQVASPDRRKWSVGIWFRN